MPIDTLKAAKRLQEENTFSPEQAERPAEVLSDLDVASATKGDLEDVEGRLSQRIDRLSPGIDDLESRISQQFEDLEERMSQRIELWEDRLGRRIAEVKSDLYRALMIGLGAIGTLILVANYLMG